MDTQLEINDGYIPETDGFIQLKSYFVDNCPKTTSLASLTMATDLLKQILFRMYKATDYGLLVKRATTNLDECQLFSKHMAEALRDSGWAVSTSRNISSIHRHLLIRSDIRKRSSNKRRCVQMMPTGSISLKGQPIIDPMHP